MKKLYKTLLIVLGSIVLLLLITTISNILLTQIDKQNVSTYGNKLLVNQQHLNVAVKGSGEKTIVLLPGFGTGSPVLDFTPLINSLSKQYKTVVIEPFGYGLSDPALSDRTIEAMTDEIHSCLQNLGITKYVLMPHSIAGIYSLYYCNKYPDEVVGLIGIDTSLPDQFEHISADNGMKILSFLSRLGLLRVITKLFPDIILARDIDAVYTAEIRNDIRKLTLLNFNNFQMEQDQMENNFNKTRSLEFPEKLPVLFFISKDSMTDVGDWWLEGHEKQVGNLKKSKIILLNGPHYLHHNYSEKMAKLTFQFLE